MKTFKDIISEVADPKPRREKAFKDKHVVQKIDHPVGEEDQFVATNVKKDKTKKASHHDGDDVAVYEEVEELDELSQETLRNYHGKAGADRLKAKAEVEKGMAQKKFTPASVQKTADSYKRFVKRGKGMTTAANKMDEEKMSDAEMKKREDIVMGMKKSKADLKKRYGDRWKSVMYATATKNAMKEAKAYVSSLSPKLGEKGSHDVIGKDGKVVKSFPYSKEGMMAAQKHLSKLKESVELDEDISKMSHSRLKWHMNTGVPHGSFTKDEMKKERDRRLKTGEGEAYKKAKPMLEEVEQVDEISKAMLGRYIKKAKTDVAGQAYQLGAKDPLKPKASWSKALGREKHIDKAVDRLTKEEYMDEAFKAGSMKLADGSSVKVTSEEASTLNALFNQLNASNKAKMNERLMSGSQGFNEILSFAKEAI